MYRRTDVATVLVGAGLLLFAAASAPAQNPSNNNPARTDPARTDPARTDPNAVSGDLSNAGGPGLINSPVNRAPDELPDHKISDKQFIERAVMRGLAEVELGRLAAEKASTDPLKKLGQTLVDDRTKLNARLGRLAGKEGMAVPGSLDSRHQARVDKAAKLSGVDFDKAFIREQVNIHERDAQAFLQESQDGADAAVRTFALKTLPIIQDHLVKVKSFEKSKPAKQ